METTGLGAQVLVVRSQWRIVLYGTADVSGSWVWNLLHVSLLEPRILRCNLYFLEIVSLCTSVRCPTSFSDLTQHLSYRCSMHNLWHLIWHLSYRCSMHNLWHLIWHLSYRCSMHDLWHLIWHIFRTDASCTTCDIWSDTTSFLQMQHARPVTSDLAHLSYRCNMHDMWHLIWHNIFLTDAAWKTCDIWSDATSFLQMQHARPVASDLTHHLSYRCSMHNVWHLIWHNIFLTDAACTTCDIWSDTTSFLQMQHAQPVTLEACLTSLSGWDTSTAVSTPSYTLAHPESCAALSAQFSAVRGRTAITWPSAWPLGQMKSAWQTSWAFRPPDVSSGQTDYNNAMFLLISYSKI